MQGLAFAESLYRAIEKGAKSWRIGTVKARGLFTSSFIPPSCIYDLMLGILRVQAGVLLFANISSDLLFASKDFVVTTQNYGTRDGRAHI